MRPDPRVAVGDPCPGGYQNTCKRCQGSADHEGNNPDPLAVDTQLLCRLIIAANEEKFPPELRIAKDDLEYDHKGDHYPEHVVHIQKLTSPQVVKVSGKLV